MRLPIVATKTHLGKSIEVDSDRETLTLFGPGGEELGTLPWESIINQLLAKPQTVTPQEHRIHPRVPLSFHIRYSTPEGKKFKGMAQGIGIGGLFIESTMPLVSGTKLSMELALPSDPEQWLQAKGEVAWVCPKADQYTFSPGMGIRFTDIAPETRKWIVSLIQTPSPQGQKSDS